MKKTGNNWKAQAVIVKFSSVIFFLFQKLEKIRQVYIWLGSAAMFEKKIDVQYHETLAEI